MKSHFRICLVIIGLALVTGGFKMINEERAISFEEIDVGSVSHVAGVHGAEAPNQPPVAAQNDLVEELTDDQFMAKIAADMAEGKTCAELAAGQTPVTVHVESAKVDVQGKQVTVSSLVQKALNDQRRLLAARQNDLDRWSRADQIHFAKWFGTNSEQARELISERIRVLTLLNNEYSVGNFRKVVPSQPGIFAFVHSNDPSKIFVDKAFIFGSFLGENSRAGTICHEMSHFTLAGGTKDLAYGAPKCKRLAQLSPAHALSNADNFEFYVEGVR